MPYPLRLSLLLCAIVVMLCGCGFSYKEGWTRPLPLPNRSPLIIAPGAPKPAPDSTLYPPRFEVTASVVSWARPIAPENSFNTQFTPDGQTLLYLAHHPGGRWTSLYSVPLAGGEAQLLGTANAEDEILDYEISLDSRRVLYYQVSNGDGLYSNTIAGTDLVQLASGTVGDAAISPDGEWAVYWMWDGAEKYTLFSVPAGGGTPVRLARELLLHEAFKITPDSRYVLYLAAKEEGGIAGTDLYRVPIEGGTPLLLSDGAPLDSNSKFFVTPDSQRVIFGNLYRVSIDGDAPQQLNPAANSAQPTYPFSLPPQLSRDGEWVVFLGGDECVGQVALYGVPLAGGRAIELNAPLAEDENIHGFFISPDDQRVSYWGQSLDGERYVPLQSVPIGGGDVVTLDEWDWVQQSQDGRWFVYGVGSQSGDYDIYSIPSTGGRPIQLNAAAPTTSIPTWATIASDSRTVLFVTGEEIDAFQPVFDALYVVDIEGGIEGGGAREITGLDGEDRLLAYFLSPDGQHAIVLVDYDGNGRFALYAISLAALP